MAVHPDTPPKYLTPKQLAERWQVTPMTLRRWRRDGKIRVYQLGRGVRFSLTEVEQFEAQGRV